MAKRKPDANRFRTDLAALSRSIPEPLHLPSLDEDRLEGFAHLFLIVLPQLTSSGDPVFTDAILQELFLVLDDRFGGCMVPSSTAHPPFWGLIRRDPAEKSQQDDAG